MNETKRTVMNKYRRDIILISALLLLSVAIFLAVYFAREDGAVVTVEIDGVTVAEYPLSLDGVFTLNNGTNVLVIENGRAYMSFSDCPDHTCEKRGKVQYVGQSIVCLPNRITVTVTGDTENGVDLVS